MSTKCESCGVEWEEHLGIMGTCAQLRLRTEERDAALWVMENRGQHIKSLEAKLKRANAKITRLETRHKLEHAGDR